MNVIFYFVESMKVKTSLVVEDGVRRYIFTSYFRSITLGMESNMTVEPAKIPAGYIMVRVLLYSSFTSPLRASPSYSIVITYCCDMYLSISQFTEANP